MNRQAMGFLLAGMLPLAACSRAAVESAMSNPAPAPAPVAAKLAPAAPAPATPVAAPVASAPGAITLPPAFAANRMINDYARSAKRSVDGENVPQSFWPPEFVALHPERIYVHGMDAVVVQKVEDGYEKGVYFTNPLACTLSVGLNDGFEFEKGHYGGAFKRKIAK